MSPISEPFWLRAGAGSPDEPQVWAAHLAVVEGDAVAGVQFETDRARFLGRGRVIRTPVSVIDGQPLSNTAGAVLDPIFSIRKRIRLAPGAAAHVTYWTLAASSRREVLDLVDRHRTPAAFERSVTLAWTQAQVQLFHLRIGAEEATMFQRLASHVLYANPALRPSSDVLTRSEGAQPALWGYGISGDLPIVVCWIDDISDLQIVRQLLQAHEYWRMKQLAVDLVILNEHPESYAQELRTSLEAMVRATESRRLSGGPTAPTRGAVFILRAETRLRRGTKSSPKRRARRALQPPGQPLRTIETPGRSGAFGREIAATHRPHVGAAIRAATGTRIL